MVRTQVGPLPNSSRKSRSTGDGRRKLLKFTEWNQDPAEAPAYIR